MRDILVLPTFIVSLISLSLSLWVAYQVGRLDFERRRQELLNSVNAFANEGFSKRYEYETLGKRLMCLPIESIEGALKEDWGALHEKVMERIRRLEKLSENDKAFVTDIENLTNGLLNRVRLEEAIGGRLRAEAEFDARWLKVYERDEKDVTELEGRFGRLRKTQHVNR